MCKDGYVWENPSDASNYNCVADTGAGDGTADGSTSGNTTGNADGSGDGNTDGTADGTSNGSSTGNTDGNTDGSTDGSTNGSSDGNADGSSDGGSDGGVDGATTPSDPFVLTFSYTSAYSVNLVLKGEVDVAVDWGTAHRDLPPRATNPTITTVGLTPFASPAPSQGLAASQDTITI